MSEAYFGKGTLCLGTLSRDCAFRFDYDRGAYSFVVEIPHEREEDFIFANVPGGLFKIGLDSPRVREAMEQLKADGYLDSKHICVIAESRGLLLCGIGYPNNTQNLFRGFVTFSGTLSSLMVVAKHFPERITGIQLHLQFLCPRLAKALNYLTTPSLQLEGPMHPSISKVSGKESTETGTLILNLGPLTFASEVQSGLAYADALTAFFRLITGECSDTYVVVAQDVVSRQPLWRLHGGGLSGIDPAMPTFRMQDHEIVDVLSASESFFALWKHQEGFRNAIQLLHSTLSTGSGSVHLDVSVVVFPVIIEALLAATLRELDGSAPADLDAKISRWAALFPDRLPIKDLRKQLKRYRNPAAHELRHGADLEALTLVWDFMLDVIGEIICCGLGIRINRWFYSDKRERTYGEVNVVSSDAPAEAS